MSFANSFGSSIRCVVLLRRCLASFFLWLSFHQTQSNVLGLLQGPVYMLCILLRLRWKWKTLHLISMTLEVSRYKKKSASFWGLWTSGFPGEPITLSLPRHRILGNGKPHASLSLGMAAGIDWGFLNCAIAKAQVCGVYFLRLQGETVLGKDEQKQFSWRVAESLAEHTANTKRCLWSLLLLDLK